MNDQPRVRALYGTSGPWAAVLLSVAFVALSLAVLRRVLKSQ